MEVQVSRLIAAIPERVMRAVTEPEQLSQWGCGKAEVMGDRFWLTGGSIPTGGVEGQILECGSSGRRLVWLMGERRSTVEISLEAVPQLGNPPADFTRITVRHLGIADGLFQARWPEESWAALWSLWLRHLKGWVERAESPVHFSFTGPFEATVERSLDLDAPPGRVWRALTDPGLRQRWLTVPLGPELQREEGRLLVCRFELDAQATILTWRLEELPGNRTRLFLREEGLAWRGVDNHLGWHDYLVALQHEVAPPLIRQTILIDAPPARVWPYVASEAGLRRWFASTIRFEPRIGAPVTLEAHGGRLRGQVTAVQPDRLLSFSWTEEGVGWPEPEPLLITLELVPEGKATRVILTHSGFENLPEAIRAREFAGYQRGWAAGDSLPALKAIVEAEVPGASTTA